MQLSKELLPVKMASKNIFTKTGGDSKFEGAFFPPKTLRCGGLAIFLFQAVLAAPVTPFMSGGSEDVL